MKTSICHAQPNFEAIRIFLLQNCHKKTRKIHKIKFVIAIFGSSRPSTKIKLPRLNSPSKTESDRHHFLSPSPKFVLSWPDLTWPQPQIHPNVIQIISWVLPLHSMSKMTHKTCVTHSPFSSYFVMTFGDLTWPRTLHGVLSIANRLLTLRMITLSSRPGLSATLANPGRSAVF